MCTAISMGCYFGRTLDYGYSYTEEVTLTPRNFPLSFRHAGILPSHHAMLGMAYVADGYPLYYDAVNEKGLAGAGLNFTESADYHKEEKGRDNVAQFELIPWVLGQCASVTEAEHLLKNTVITPEVFRQDLPCAKLHWIFADRERAITVESLKDGFHILPNPVGVLTNEPPFPQQLYRLRDFMGLSPKAPENRFAPALNLTPYSRGMGAMGLPGDLSSSSRFIRTAFTLQNSHYEDSEISGISQFFHVLNTAAQTRGCCVLEDGSCEITIYTSCMDVTRGIYYYTTYENQRITAVDLHKENPDGVSLIRYALKDRQDIFRQN